MDTQEYLYLALGSLGVGYVIFLILLYFLPRRLRAGNKLQTKLVINDAKKQVEKLKSEEYERTSEKIQAASEELEGAYEDRVSDCAAREADMEQRQEYLEYEQHRVEKRAKDLDQVRARRDRAKQAHDSILAEQEKLKQTLQTQLVSVAQVQPSALVESMKSDLVRKRQLDCTKYLKFLDDELSSSSKRMANRFLATTQSRYAPEFIWPKGVSHVEVKDSSKVELLAADPCKLIDDLVELSEGVNVTLDQSGAQPVVRLGGGFGIYKEAVKLSLEDLLNRHPNTWAKVESTYAHHRRKLEQQAETMGKQALYELQLDGIHVEILKMVGSLNWRTSYRQNQYFHSLEVAKLAGILAQELGVDPDQAKRCGLLHDIGKSIDYRIEGSHAVISGDYADRYGENKVICDTVMSHHADLIVETPLAYVLQAADTLSGARPGARVNLEEGYQDRLSSIDDVVKTFPGIVKVEIMNGAREVHVEVNHKKVSEDDLQSLSSAIAKQVEENVAYPGQIKILVTRRFESVAVA